MPTFVVTGPNASGARFQVNIGAAGATGQGVPTGGSTGQVLAKASGTDFDTVWAVGGSGTGNLVNVTEIDGSPNINAVTLQFPNGTLTNPSGSVARYTPADKNFVLIDGSRHFTGDVTFDNTHVNNGVPLAVVADNFQTAIKTGDGFTNGVQIAMGANSRAFNINSGTWNITADDTGALSFDDDNGSGFGTDAAGGSFVYAAGGTQIGLDATGVAVTGSIHATNLSGTNTGDELVSIAFSHGDAPAAIYTAPSARRIIGALINYRTAFDQPAATVKVGISNGDGSIIGISDSLPQLAGVYEVSVDTSLAPGGSIWLTISQAGSVTGAGVITLFLTSP